MVSEAIVKLKTGDKLLNPSGAIHTVQLVTDLVIGLSDGWYETDDAKTVKATVNTFGDLYHIEELREAGYLLMYYPECSDE